MHGGGSSELSGNCLLIPSAHLQGAHSVPSQMHSSGSRELSGNHGLFTPSARQRQTTPPPLPHGVISPSARQGTFTGPLLCSVGAVLPPRHRILPHLDWACCLKDLLLWGQQGCSTARGRSFLPHQDGECCQRDLRLRVQRRCSAARGRRIPLRLDWACLWKGPLLRGPGRSAARGRRFLPQLEWACNGRGPFLPGCSAHLDPLCHACLVRGGWQLGPSGIGSGRQAHC